MYADPELDTKPELLSERGGAFYSEAAVALLSSLSGDTKDIQVVNVRNNGTFGSLDDGAVIEELAVDAALRGGRERVAAALLAHPLVGQYPPAEAMTDRLISGNVDFLPWALSP